MREVHLLVARDFGLIGVIELCFSASSAARSPLQRLSALCADEFSRACLFKPPLVSLYSH